VSSLNGSASPSDQAPGHADELVLTMPARADSLSVLRATVAAAAASRNLVVDDVEDLRLIAQEAGALLVAAAADGAVLTCRQAWHHDHVRLSLATTLRPDAVVDEAGFGWTVLTALAEDAKTSTVDGTTVLEVSHVVEPVVGSGVA
jgi:hypothetical protein